MLSVFETFIDSTFTNVVVDEVMAALVGLIDAIKICRNVVDTSVDWNVCPKREVKQVASMEGDKGFHGLEHFASALTICEIWGTVTGQENYANRSLQKSYPQQDCKFFVQLFVGPTNKVGST